MCCCDGLIKSELSQCSGVSYTDNTAPQAGRESSITHTPQHTPTHSFCSSLSFHKVTLTLPSSGGKNPSLRPRALTATIPGRNCLTHTHSHTHRYSQTMWPTNRAGLYMVEFPAKQKATSMFDDWQLKLLS